MTLEEQEICVPVAGHSSPGLVVYPGVVWCGEIHDGVSLRLSEDRGSWVIAFADLKRVYEAAAKARHGASHA